MGMLLDGTWHDQDPAAETGKAGNFQRVDSVFRDRITLFKCNRNRIADYPNLSNHMRELYQMPGIAETVKPRYYVMTYYSIARVSPSGIIPKGTPVDFRQPHDRARFAA